MHPAMLIVYYWFVSCHLLIYCGVEICSIFLFFRNVVTGAHYHFVSRFTYSAAYIVAALVMLLFVSIDTKIITYLLYSSNSAYKNMHISDPGYFDAAEILTTPDIRLYRGASSDARV